jgi:hypothetical protein
MSSSKARAGADRSAAAERTTDEAFEAAVRRLMAETGLPERKARFVTAIECGILPDGDVVTVRDDSQEAAADREP